MNYIDGPLLPLTSEWPSIKRDASRPGSRSTPAILWRSRYVQPHRGRLRHLSVLQMRRGRVRHAPRKRISIKSATVAGLAASALLGLTGIALNPASAKAVVYCPYVRYPAACVARAGVVLGARPVARAAVRHNADGKSRWSSTVKAGTPRLVRRYMWLSPSPATAPAVPSPKQKDDFGLPDAACGAVRS
jgi:hypothetical protein